MARRKLMLSLNRLDDRIAPSSSGSPVNPDWVFAPPQYWQESKFLPVSTTPADDGGEWVVGTTQRAGRYSWWGPWNNDWAVVKLTAAGVIDPSFNGGKVKDLDTGVLDWFRILELHTGADGKLYALGRNISHDPIPLYAASSSANSFMTSAPPNPNLGAPLASNSPYTVGSLVDGSVLRSSLVPIPAPTPNESFALIRFNADGSLDSTFDQDGITLFDLDARTDQWWFGGQDAHFTVGADGSLVVAGVRTEYTPGSGLTTIDAVRFTSSGALDNSFDSDGRASLVIPLQSAFANYTTGVLLGVATDSHGEIVFGGSVNVWYYGQSDVPPPTTDTSYSALFAAKLKADGSADTSFDQDGIVLIRNSALTANSGMNVSDFKFTSDGSMLYAGTLSPEQNPLAIYPYPHVNQAFVAKLTSAGSLDPSFDGDGILLPNFSQHLNVTSGDRIELLSNGDFAFAGQEQKFISPELPVDPANYVIAKFHADGSLDATFTPIRQTPASYGYISDLDGLPDGRLLAVVSYPAQLIAIDADGARAVPVNIPYDRVGPWQPPPDFKPFLEQPTFRSITGDFNGDGIADYAYATGRGSETSIRIVDGATGNDLVSGFHPYENQFRGGMFMAAGDFNGDGKDDLVVSADEGGSARVQVLTMENGTLVQKANFFAIQDVNFRGGGTVAVADINGDGTPDLIVGAAAGGSQRIATFDGKQLFGQQTTLPPVLFGDYFAPLTGLDPLNYRGGVSLEINDVDGDGHNDVVITPTVDVGVGPDFGIVVFHGSLDGNQHRLRYQKWVGNEVPKHADGQDQYMSLFDNVFRPLAG